MYVELWGGPLDGEIRDVLGLEYHVPVAQTLVSLMNDYDAHPSSLNFKTESYKYMGRRRSRKNRIETIPLLEYQGVQ